MNRKVVLLVVSLLLGVPATSWAGDPLLSGYGGPGTGQQVLLGSHLLGKGGGGTSGGGSLRAAAPSGSATSGAVAAPAAGGGAKAAHGGSRANGGSRAHAQRKPAATVGTSTATPRRVAYPSRGSDGGGLPFSAGEVLAGLLALLAVAGMGVWMRRVAAHGGGPGAQAPS